MNSIDKNSYMDVEKYHQDLLKINDNSIEVQVTYKKIWDDGFGARGWKLNSTIGDPDIIASTRETGKKINTSVFIHDILDHFLSGFGVSGHRSEAMALVQLFKRTGSDPRPDYEQMVQEDIFNGRVNKEDFVTFLPIELRTLLPLGSEMLNKEIIFYLKDLLGSKQLCKILVDHFFTLGKSGERHAIESWKKLRLNPEKRTGIGLALQAILNKVDCLAEETSVEIIKASISISNEKCVMTLDDDIFQKTVYCEHIA